MNWRAFLNRRAAANVQEAGSKAPEIGVVSSCCSQTEQAFLHLGALLSELTDTSTRALSTADQLVRWSEGRLEFDSQPCARDSLDKAMGAMREHSAACRAALDHIAAAIQGLARIARQQELIGRQATALQYSAVMLRLETLALDSGDSVAMLDLIERMSGLESQLRSFCEERLDRFKSITDTMRDASASVLETIGALEQRAAAIQQFLDSLSNATPEIGALQEAAHQAKSALPGGFTRAVVALQCQDSVRQRLEHVAAAVDAKIGDGLFYEIQIRQTGAALADLRVAEDSVRNELAALARQAASVSEAAEKAQQELPDRQEIGELLVHAQGAERLLEKAVLSAEQLLNGFEPLERTFHEFRSGLAHIGFDLHLAALNAQVLACRADVPGRGVGVAADWAAKACQEVLTEARALLQTLDNTVRLTTELACSLEHRRQGLLSSSTELSRHFAALPGQMRMAQERLSNAVETLNEGACTLRREVDGAVTRLSFANDAEIALAGFVAYLKERRSETDVEDDSAVEAARGNYSMDREREIHREASGSAETQADQESASDDNIELF